MKRTRLSTSYVSTFSFGHNENRSMTSQTSPIFSLHLFVFDISFFVFARCQQLLLARVSLPSLPAFSTEAGQAEPCQAPRLFLLLGCV